MTGKARGKEEEDLGYARGNQRPWICLQCYFVYMKIDAGLKVKTARTWLCFQRPCALVVSADVRVTMRTTWLTRKCPAVRFALYHEGHADVHFFWKLRGGLQPPPPPTGSASADANSRSNVRPATGVPDHRAAHSEKEATMTKQANDFRGRIFSREDIFARGYFRGRIFSREDIFAWTV